METLFGKKESKTAPVETTPGPIKEVRADWSNALRNIYNTGGGPTYQGPLVAGINPNETSALANANQLQTNPAIAQLLNQTMGGNFLPGQPGANPFFDAAVQAAQRQTTDQYRSGVERALGSSTAANQLVQGGFRGGLTGARGSPGSTAFDRMFGDLTNQFGQTLGGIAATMGNEQFGRERALQQQAVSVNQEQVKTAIANAQAQGLPRLIEQMGYTEAARLFPEKMKQLLEALRIGTGASGLSSFGQQGTATETPGLVGGITGAIGNLRGTPFLPSASMKM